MTLANNNYHKTQLKCELVILVFTKKCLTSLSTVEQKKLNNFQIFL